MPTYDYVCDSCGHRQQAFQQMTDPRIEECPSCGEKIRRLIGKGGGIIFRGTGFYETDYKKKGK